MKALLTKRSFVVLLCVIVLFGSLLVNTRVKLGREAQRVSEIYYSEDISAYNEAAYAFLSRNGNGYTRLCASLAGVKYPTPLG